MKKCMSKLLSAILVAALVFTSAGVVFADDGLKKTIPDVEKNLKAVENASGEKAQAKASSDNNEIAENAKSSYDKFNNSEKMTVKKGTALASEGTNVAQIGEAGYISLQAAINAAVDGDVINVMEDITEEYVLIDIGVSSLTIDFNGNYIGSSEVDTVTVNSGNVVIKDAFIFNSNSGSETNPAGIYAIDGNVTMDNCAIITSGNRSAGYYVENAYTVLNNCYYESDCEVGAELVSGAVVDDGGILKMNDCDIETIYGYGVLSFGKVYINDSYIISDNEDYCAVIITDSGKASINDGYYYGGRALYVADINSSAIVKKGEFESCYMDWSAIDTFDDESFGTNVSIENGYVASPANWKTYGANSIYVYKKYPAPTSVTPKLYKYYNGVSLSWSKVTGAKAYKVYYKKSTSSNYTYLKMTTGTSLTKTRLSPGAKYYFRVYPCDTLDKTTKIYYGKYNYRYNSIYTLKKLNTPYVSKNSKYYVKVKWNNILGESGYQISKSTSKTGTNIVYTYKTTTGTYKTLKATRGKTYYYKVRAYKTVGSQRIYAPWSSVRAYKLR